MGGRIGNQLIEPSNIFMMKACNLPIVIDTDDDLSALRVGQRHHLGRQGIDIGEVLLELMPGIFSAIQDFE